MQGAGLFSKLGGYVQQAGRAGNNIGRLMGHVGSGGLGRTAQGAYQGAAAGAAWGMASDDTSVIGGALMGAAGGAGIMRYGSVGMRGWNAASRYKGASRTRAFSRSIAKQAKSDFSGTVLSANRAMNRVRSTLSSPIRGMTPLM